MAGASVFWRSFRPEAVTAPKPSVALYGLPLTPLWLAWICLTLILMLAYCLRPSEASLRRFLTNTATQHLQVEDSADAQTPTANTASALCSFRAVAFKSHVSVSIRTPGYHLRDLGLLSIATVTRSRRDVILGIFGQWFVIASSKGELEELADWTVDAHDEPDSASESGHGSVSGDSVGIWAEQEELTQCQGEIQELQTQLEQIRRGSLGPLERELEEVRWKKREEEKARSEVRARTKVLEEGKRAVEARRRDAERRLKVARSRISALEEGIAKRTSDL